MNNDNKDSLPSNITATPIVPFPVPAGGPPPPTASAGGRLTATPFLPASSYEISIKNDDSDRGLMKLAGHLH